MNNTVIHSMRVSSVKSQPPDHLRVVGATMEGDCALEGVKNQPRCEFSHVLLQMAAL